MKIKHKIYWFLGGFGLNLFFAATALGWPDSPFNVDRIYTAPKSNLGSIALGLLASLVLGLLILVFLKKKNDPNYSRVAGILFATGFFLFHLALFTFEWLMFKDFSGL